MVLVASLAIGSVDAWAQCAALNAVVAKQRDNLMRLLPCLTDPNCPSLIQTEDLGRTCRSTTHVWARSSDGRFAVIRDLKMCKIGPGPHDESFVHGLAIPLAPISGVEDDKVYATPEQNGIWRLAWESALAKGLREEEIALVATPPGTRSQNLLHVHVVRRNQTPLPAGIEIADLATVWQQAAQLDKDIACRNYGIVVTRSGGAFRLLVEEGDADANVNPEGKYTVERREQATARR
jgi:hypothetical protein